jgi:hypothetical protein
MELLIALVVAGLVVAYISRKRNPLKVCKVCKGAGVLPSAVWSGRYRPCHGCNRKGEVRSR